MAKFGQSYTYTVKENKNYLFKKNNRFYCNLSADKDKIVINLGLMATLMPNDIVLINTGQIRESECTDTFINEILFDTVLFSGVVPNPEVLIAGPLGTISNCVEINLFISQITNDLGRGLKTV